MSQGLLALIDDVAVIAKIAAASLDDAAALTAKAGTKAAGIVIDDAAVTPKYVVGFAADRELPIIVKIAKGSLKAKLLLLLPGALLMSAWAPWVLNPLLLGGGLYLSLEGFHKCKDLVRPPAKGADDDAAPIAATAAQLEDQRVKSALRTDLILSAEVMVIALAEVSSASIAMQAAVLAVVGAAVTFVVYGVVALIVKADDAGVALARRYTSGPLHQLGRFMVSAMPPFLNGLSLVGMVAMLWVGGGIIVHALHGLGVHAPEDALKAAAAAAERLPVVGGAVGWLTGALLSLLVGLAVGAVADGVGAIGRKALAGRRRKATSSSTPRPS